MKKRLFVTITGRMDIDTGDDSIEDAVSNVQLDMISANKSACLDKVSVYIGYDEEEN